MDYHRYAGLAVGAVPPLLGPGTPLENTQAGGGGPPAMLPPHPSLMFHYGVAAKPAHGLPPHLLPPTGVPPSVAMNLSTAGALTSSTKSSLTPIPSAGLSLPPPLAAPPCPAPPPTSTSSSSGRSSSPSSSFAAALRCLAKQATTPAEIELAMCNAEAMTRSSPKVSGLACVSSAGSGGGAGTAPTISSMAPSVMPMALASEMDRLPSSLGEDLMRGFQPYRAPESLVVVSSPSGGGSLRPPLPMEMTQAYSPYHPSLYTHPLVHQYRLEEQLYLERYGLLRPSLSPYALSSLYAAQNSPYQLARFPPELLPSSLAALHPSSALLHERLKLEEDIRQREYELELRRGRELEREREREREKGKERDKERERHRKREHEKNKEAHHHHSSRDRSPGAALVSSSASAIVTSFTGGGSTAAASSPLPFGNSVNTSPLISDITKTSGKIASEVHSANVTTKPRTQCIVRPFETGVVVNCASGSGTVSLTGDTCHNVSLGNNGKETTVKVESNFPPIANKVTVKLEQTEHRAIWQPVNLDVVSAAAEKKLRTVIPTPSSPVPPPPLPPLVSQLDLEGKRLRELRLKGLLQEEAEEALLTEDLKRGKELKEMGQGGLGESPPPLDTSPEKMNFLTKVGLMTHAQARDAELNVLERRVPILTAMNNMTVAMETEPVSVPEELVARLAPLQKGASLSREEMAQAANQDKFMNLLELCPQNMELREEVEFIWHLVIAERLKRYKPESESDELGRRVCEALECILAVPNTTPMKMGEAKMADVEMMDIKPTTDDKLNSHLPFVGNIDDVKLLCSNVPNGVIKSGVICHSTAAQLMDVLNSTPPSDVKTRDVTPIVLPHGEGGSDPLLFGLQGLDTVIECFIKNAQAQGGTNNSALLEHVEEVRKSQVALCQTAQQVQDQVAQLVASRAQLEAHRSALHHHLASITTLVTNGTNHLMSPRPPSNGAPNGTPVVTSLPNVNLTSMAGVLPLPHPFSPLAPPKGVSSAALLSWAGLATPYLAAAIPVSLEGKEALLFPVREEGKSVSVSKTTSSTVNTSHRSHKSANGSINRQNGAPATLSSTPPKRVTTSKALFTPLASVAVTQEVQNGAKANKSAMELFKATNKPWITN